MRTPPSLILSSALLVAACASADIQNISDKSFAISASAAAVCEMSNKEYSDRAAAIEVIKRGGDKFVYLDNQTQRKTVKIAVNGRITPHTQIKNVGTVLMVEEGQAGYDHALSARKILGPDWQNIVQKGLGLICISE